MEADINDFSSRQPVDGTPPDVPERDDGDRRRRRLIANRAFGAIKAQRAAERSWIEATADSLNAAASSTTFLVIHALWFAIWILWNTGLTPWPKYTSSRGETLVLDDECVVRNDPDRDARKTLPTT